MNSINETSGNGHKPIQQLAQSSLELLPLIMNNIPQAVFWKDRNLVYLGCNRAFAEDTGFSSPEEVIGKTDFDMPWKEQADLYRADDRLVMESGESKLNYEEPQTTPDGSKIWLSTSKIPVRENGQVVAVLGMYEDITVRKRAEQAIKESEEKFKAIADNTAVGLFIYQEGIVRYVGLEAARLLGYNVSETIGRSIMDFIHPDERQHIADMVRRRTARENVPDQYETRMLKKDGSALDVLMFGMMIEYEGKPATQGAFLDLTERKQAEEAVRESEDRFRRFTEATVEGLVFHEQGRIVDANPAAIAMFGFSNVTGLIGRNLLEFIAPDSHELVLKQMQLESVQPYEIQGIRKDGSSFPIETSTRAYKTGKRTIRASSLRDISGRKLTEALLESMLENSPEAIGIVDLTSGLFTDLNENSVRLFGLPRAELAKVGPAQMSPPVQPDGRPSTEKAMEKINAAMQGVNQVFEWTHRNARGKDIPCEVRLARLPGDRPRVRFSVTDITERKHADEVILESEERFRRFTEATNEGLVFHEQGKIVDANPAALAMFGLSDNKEILGKSLLEFVVPEDHALVLKQMQLETVLPYEAQCVRKNGATFPIETSTRTYKIGGRTIRATSIQDITARKQAEADTLREKNVSDTTINSLPGIFYMFDTKGNLVRRNKNYETVAGYSAGETATRTALDAVAEEDRERVAQAIQKAFTEGKVELEMLFKTRRGEKIPYLMTATRMTIGNDMFVLGTGINLSERKQAEQALRDSEARYSAVVTQAKDGVVIIQDNVLQFVNQAVADMLGYTTAEMEKTPIIGYLAPESRLMVAERVKARLAGQEVPSTYEAKMLRKDGTIFDAEFSAAAIEYRGKPADVGMIRDITERKRLEIQVQTAFERRGRQVQLSTQVSQSIAAATGLEDLYHRVVTQVKEQFGYYHVQLLRYDAAQNAVVLITGYGETGSKMLSAGHRLPMGEGLIGTAAASGETVLRPVLIDDPDWHPNPLLPETKGEIAVPIKLGDTILGVLDVQSNVANALDADDQLLLEGLCGQIATAIESTRLSQQMGERLEEINRLYQAMSHEGWQAYRESSNVPEGFMFDQSGLKPIKEIGLAEELFSNLPLTVPGGEVIGTLAIADDPQRPITPEDQTFLQQVSEQVALALESARLFEQTQSALNESKEAEEVVRASEAKLSEALEIAKLANWEYDVERDRFLFNDHFYSIFHTTAKEMGGYELSSAEYAQRLVYPDDLPVVGAAIEKALASTDKHYSTQLEHRFVYLDGGMGYISVEIHIDRDDQGKIIRYYGANQDITDRRLAEQAVRDSEAKLSEALEIAKLANWEYDVERDRFLFNDHFYSIFHSNVKEMGGYELSSAEYAQRLVYPEDLPVVGAAIEKALASTDKHYSTQLEHRFVYLDGGMGYISVEIHIDRDDQGKIIRYYGANQDITDRRLAEQAVRDSEAKLSEALEIAKLANWEYDVERDRFLFNDHFYSIFHTNVKEMGGYELSSAEYAQRLVYPEDLPVVGAAIEKALASTDKHYSTRLEHRVAYADGGMGYISVDIHIDRDDQGKIVRYYGANQDITERRLAEQAVRDSEAKLSEALHITKLANWEHDVERNCFIFNDQYYSIFHTNAKEMGGYELSPEEYAQRLVYPDDIPMVGVEIGKGMASTEQHYSNRIEHRILYADGGVGYMSVTLNIDRDEQGRILRVYGANQDITELKLAEQAIAKRAVELQTVAEVSTTTAKTLEPDQLLQTVVDVTKERFSLYHAHIYLADETWSTLLLAAGAGEIGRKMVAQEHAIALDAEKSLVARAARERQAVIVNDVRDDPAFLPNPLLPETRSEMAVPMIVGDKVLGVFDVQSASQDAFTKEEANIYTTLASQVAVALQNARLYAEQAAAVTQLRELDRLKTAFLANMSHELRTPLNSILGFSDVIIEGLDGPVTEQMDNDLRLIGKNGQHLLHLINDVLDMAKIDAGRMNLQPEKVKLNGLIEEAINITSPLASAKSLALVIKKGSDRRVDVFADRTRIQQVMINLINNAIKFTEKGEVTLYAKKKGDSVLIEVHDTGIGIPPEQLQIIFQEFTQVDSSTTRKTGGTGLGLPISRRLIEMHGGRLWAESSGVAGEGSTFYVELPLIAKITEPVEVKER